MPLHLAPGYNRFCSVGRLRQDRQHNFWHMDILHLLSNQGLSDVQRCFTDDDKFYEELIAFSIIEINSDPF